MIGQVISHYRIISQLGEGGMGVVYVAEDTRLGRRVAVKIPSAPSNGNNNSNNYHARFLREARSVSALSHPNIATVYDYGETEDGRPFLVMELIHGQDLGVLMRAGALTLARAVEIIEQVATALGEAHRIGIVHRDVKPSNVLVNERDEVKVLDFGLAKLIEDRPEFAAVDTDARTLMSVKTRSDVIVGTPLYLSPEQATGAPVDARSDIFALGALLYECVAGQPAFSGANLIEIAAQVLHVEPPPPSHVNPRVPPELDRITMKALAKRPEDRYQRAADLVADLRAFRSAYTLSADAPVERISRHTGLHNRSALVTLSEGLRRPRLSIAAMLGVILMLIGGLWLATYLLRPRVHVPDGATLRAYERAVDLLRDNSYYQASKALARVVETDPQFVLAHARSAEALTELDNLDQAKDEMLRARSLAPDLSALPELDARYLEAIQATVERDYPRAIAAYDQLTKLLPKQPQAWLDLGRAYEKADKTDEAIKHYVAATELDAHYATAFLRVGVLYARKGLTPNAVSCFNRAEEIYRADALPEGWAEVLYQRGMFLRGLGKIPEARAALDQALKLAESTGNQAQRVNVLTQLSAVAASENKGAQAEEYARQAVDTAQASDMQNLAARALIDLGNVYLVLGRYEQADKYYTQVLELARRAKARRTEARAQINLASSKLQQWRPDEATGYIKPALQFYESGNYRREALLAHLLVGRAQRMKGDYEGALATFRQWLPVAQQAGEQVLVPQLHEGIGSVLALQEHYGEALKQFDERYTRSQDAGQKIGAGYGQAERADVLWRMGRFDEARAPLAEALAVADRPDGNQELAGMGHVISAEMALATMQWPAARTEAKRALDLAGERYADVRIRAKLVLGLSQTRAGRAAEGVRLCQEALAEADGIGYPALVAAAALAVAEAQLAVGDDAQALTNATRAEQNFARAGSLDSDWRAWLVAARAAAHAGHAEQAHDYAARARQVLAEFQQSWGPGEYERYLTRPDVLLAQTQLNSL
ncbi:MAG TPA: protein kinase [Pyrinomonadaceae bacterium]|jgi:tetratricopeptide (TPR) repeat protein/predicted Ser/Thr protein kinase